VQYQPTREEKYALQFKKQLLSSKYSAMSVMNDL
jgi:hypothetical protein